MKITIARQDLLDAVNNVKSVVSAKSALPILSHILFEAASNQLKLSATDLKVSIESTVDCTVEAPGSMTVQCQRLASILAELPDADIHLELSGGKVITLDCGKIHTKLYSMSPDEFPPIRNFDGVEPLVLQQSVLRDIFQKTSFAISTDQARYNLTGLLIEIKNGKLTAVATDGRRMSLISQRDGIVEGIDISVIIPGKMIHELERLLASDDEVTVQIGENQAAFTFGTLRLVTALIEGNFPNYEMVIPKEHDKTITLKTGLFTEGMRRTRTMTNDKFNSVRFVIGDGQMTLKVVTPEVGEYEEEVPITYNGDQLEIAFNPDFVLDVLRHVDAEDTCLVLKDNMSPGVLKPGNGEGSTTDYINVVMPIRI